MDTLISVSKLSKRYGRTLAVADLSFEVRAGEVVGFLGPNGAGKSTTLRILAGFIGRTAGEVKIAGFDIDDDAIEAKRRIGYLPETVPLYGEMRVAEYLRYRAELKGVPRAKRSAFVADAMAKARISDVAGVLIEQLSKGYRQRVGLADALVAKPPLLILDEPTSGLDPNQIRDVRDVIRGLGREHAVLLSTHILSEVEATCDRVLVLGKGKLLAEGATATVRRMGAQRALRVVVRGARDVVLAAARGVEAFSTVEILEAEGGAEGDAVALECAFREGADRGEAAERVVEALVAKGAHVRELRPLGGGLEAVFAELTQSEQAS